MATDLQPVFVALRKILQKHRGEWSVREDSELCYSLAGSPGPAAVQMWGGKMKKPIMPIAWVEIGKNYVSYHLMPVYGNPKLLDGVSKELISRMQGKSCFNFTAVDDELIGKLADLTHKSLARVKEAKLL